MKICAWILALAFPFLTQAQDNLLHFIHPDSTKPFESFPITSPPNISDGEVITKHLSTNRLAERYNLVNGKKFGAYRAYDPDGVLRIFTVYSNDLINGEWTYYNERELVHTKGKYLNGQKHGYWAFRADNCFGHYRHDLRQGKWKCYENGVLISRVFYDQGTLLNAKPDKEGKKENKPKPTETDPKVLANMHMNPRFMANIYIGQKVYILPYKAKSMEEKVAGTVEEIVTKKDFDGRGIRVVLADGRAGRVVEFIDPPPGTEESK